MLVLRLPSAKMSVIHSEMSWVRILISPKCPGSEVSVHLAVNSLDLDLDKVVATSFEG